MNKIITLNTVKVTDSMLLSEVANSAIVAKAGSVLYYQQLN